MTIQVKDANGVTQTIHTANANGQANSQNSSPVVIANDQSTIPVNTGLVQSLTDAQLRATPIATISSLPVGAAEDGTDATGVVSPTGGVGIRGWLSGIYDRLTKGVNTVANSLSITLASDHPVIPVSLSASPLPTGAALESGNLSEIALNTENIPTKGAASTANSLPVNIATDQIVKVSHNVSTLSSISGAITTGGTAQQLVIANANRKGIIFQNISSGPLYINLLGSDASTLSPSLMIPADSYWESPMGGCGTFSVSVYGATTGQKFTSFEY